MTGLQINGNRNDEDGYSVTEDPDSTWYIANRLTEARHMFSESENTPYLNVGNSSMDNMKLCYREVSVESFNIYRFHENVLERSTRDNGDCKTMLGEECVSDIEKKKKKKKKKEKKEKKRKEKKEKKRKKFELTLHSAPQKALKRHYAHEATSWMALETCTDTVPNWTVPHECRPLTNGSSFWNGGSATLPIPLPSSNSIGSIPSNENCSDTLASLSEQERAQLNTSVYGLGSWSRTYARQIAFAQPSILVFYPDRTPRSSQEGVQIRDRWAEDVHVEVLCMRPADVEEGSWKPLSAEALLQAENAFYDENATDPEEYNQRGGEDGGGEASPTESQGLGAPVRTVAPYLGALGLAAMVLV
ncbi:hypothetical protein BS50DRAFT_633648 [Corynespora cassiicola Philippines]|uniref:Uncharacterized protein n=1 Tax=Corynespora cassiicola Philippines TaxID=1448308 RepID=A0A2T2NRE7_CORCC|nr:hypothetical protein BS50DRAFT_633648 [Corynespora cassiicola Philippines]